MEDKNTPDKAVAAVSTPASNALALGEEVRKLVAGTPVENDAMIIATMFMSGLFKDTTSLSKAITKALIGAQLGLNAVQSMNGINIIQDKISLDSHTQRNQAIKAGFELRTIKSTDKVCELEVWDTLGDEPRKLGTVEYTWDEATAAGLTVKDNWKKNPSDMLFARCTTRATRRYCGRAFGGMAIYDPDEMPERVVIHSDAPVVSDEMVDQVLSTDAKEKPNAKKPVADAEVVEEVKDGEAK